MFIETLDVYKAVSLLFSKSSVFFYLYCFSQKTTKINLFMQ